MDESTYERLCNLLFDYKENLAVKLSDFSGSNIMQCHIETKRDSFRMRPYRLSPSIRKELDRQIDQMIEAVIVADSDNSPFAFPVVMVKKSRRIPFLC